MTQGWRDRDIPTDVLGFKASHRSHQWAFALKHLWWQNWFKPIARIGKRGNSEYVLDPIEPAEVVVGPRNVLRSEIEAGNTGELFLFVNDVILAKPGRSNWFYENNAGAATVTVERVKD